MHKFFVFMNYHHIAKNSGAHDRENLIPLSPNNLMKFGSKGYE
jgi:hypothetical protein